MRRNGVRGYLTQGAADINQMNKLPIPCPRCGKPFNPRPTELKVIGLTRFCEECMCRNLMDGLGLPTPPEMLDKYSKYPTLTRREFNKKLSEPTPEDME